MATTAKPEAWAGVMAGLTGLRLAVHDALLRAGSLDVAAIAAQLAGDGARATALTEELPEAVAWLASHRLLVAEEGTWRAVHPALARVQFEMNGLAKVATATARPVAKPDARPMTAAVQRHQIEFFTLEGYREANGSLG